MVGSYTWAFILMARDEMHFQSRIVLAGSTSMYSYCGARKFCREVSVAEQLVMNAQCMLGLKVN